MANVHFILQGKGGVGKSAIAAILAQYFNHNERETLCIDTDPVNSTLSRYELLNVHKLEIMDGDDINPRSFDEFINLIFNTEADDIIIDNGASSFVPLSKYLKNNDVLTILQQSGHKVVFHSIITGGQALRDTIAGLKLLIDTYQEHCEFVIWLNPYWGKIESADGETFEESGIYQDYKDRVSAMIALPIYQKDTFGRDFEEMLRDHRMFDESINDSRLQIMVRQRLKIIQKQLYSLLDSARVL